MPNTRTRKLTYQRYRTLARSVVAEAHCIELHRVVQTFKAQIAEVHAVTPFRTPGETAKLENSRAF